MKEKTPESLSRRERQIMGVVYRLGRASVSEVRENLPDPPGYSAVRALLRILEGKGHLEHEEEGRKYLYRPTIPLEKASQSALGGVLLNFFNGSRAKLFAALIDDPESEMSARELDVLSRMIRQARKEGR